MRILRRRNDRKIWQLTRWNILTLTAGIVATQVVSSLTETNQTMIVGSQTVRGPVERAKWPAGNLRSLRRRQRIEIGAGIPLMELVGGSGELVDGVLLPRRRWPPGLVTISCSRRWKPPLGCLHLVKPLKCGEADQLATMPQRASRRVICALFVDAVGAKVGRGRG